MNSIRILIVLLIILGLIIIGQKVAEQSKKSSPTPTAIPSSTIIPTTSPTSNPTSIPTAIPSPTTLPPATSTPTNSPYSQKLNITDFKYPNAIVVNKNGNKLELESNDDPQKITDWYKEKIKSMDLNVTTFVQTSTNGNILNKLVGANGATEVRVEITKQNNSQVVKISISLIS